MVVEILMLYPCEAGMRNILCPSSTEKEVAALAGEEETGAMRQIEPLQERKEDHEGGGGSVCSVRCGQKKDLVSLCTS